MGIRHRLAEQLVMRLEPHIREIVDRYLSERPPPASLDQPDRFAALETKLDQVLNAFQAVSSQGVTLREGVDAARNEARQAAQLATTARSTAEAVEDGLTGLEERVDALIENLSTLRAAD